MSVDVIELFTIQAACIQFFAEIFLGKIISLNSDLVFFASCNNQIYHRVNERNQLLIET